MEDHWYSSSAGKGTIGAVGAAVVATGMMYFMDPKSGRRGCTYVRDKIYSCINQTGEFVDSTYHNLSNRAGLDQRIALAHIRRGSV